MARIGNAADRPSPQMHTARRLVQSILNRSSHAVGVLVLAMTLLAPWINKVRRYLRRVC
jgi:hypothetical protein